jgi:hypothetical protein
MAVPSDRPDVTYGLARFGGVEGKHLVSEMYDPFAYLPSGYSYAGHQDTVDTLVECWLAKTDVRIMAMPPSNQDYALMREHNPGWFVSLGLMSDTNWQVYGVEAPHPSPAQCAEASRATGG